MPLGLIHEDGKIGGSLVFVWAASEGKEVKVASLNQIDELGGRAKTADFTLDSYDSPEKVKKDNNYPWTKFVQGAVWVVQKHLREEKGIELEHGIAGALYGDLPKGGLSSSAALSLNLILALLEANNVKDITMREVTLWAKELENDYVGSNCGILDQTMIGFGKPNALTVLRNPERGGVEYVHMPEGTPFSIFIFDTGKARPEGGLQNSTYFFRSGKDREAIIACANELNLGIQNVGQLDDAGFLNLINGLVNHGKNGNLDAYLLANQVEYLRNANKNFGALLAAWEKGNVYAIRDVLNSDGRGLFEKFVISSPAQEIAVAAARAVGAGSRMAGGGDGGANIGIFIENDKITFEDASALMLEIYHHYVSKFGIKLDSTPIIYKTTNDIYGVAGLWLG